MFNVVKTLKKQEKEKSTVKAAKEKNEKKRIHFTYAKKTLREADQNIKPLA